VLNFDVMFKYVNRMIIVLLMLNLYAWNLYIWVCLVLVQNWWRMMLWLLNCGWFHD